MLRMALFILAIAIGLATLMDGHLFPGSLGPVSGASVEFSRQAFVLACAVLAWLVLIGVLEKSKDPGFWVFVALAFLAWSGVEVVLFNRLRPPIMGPELALTLFPVFVTFFFTAMVEAMSRGKPVAAAAQPERT